MKKLSFLAALLAVGLYLQAQTNGGDIVIKASKPITRQLTPQLVIDSLEKRFPNAQAVQYYKTAGSEINNGWAVTQDDNPGNIDLDYYTLSFKDKNIQYYGLYNADGTLIMSKVDQSNATLPDEVKQSLKTLSGGDLSGWKLLSKSYHKTIHHQKNKTYYEVTAQNGNEKKTIYLAPDGTVLKERYTR